MTSVENLIRKLDNFVFDENSEDRLESIAADMEQCADGQLAVDAVLKLFERFPNAEFGMPGPLAHAVERYYRQGYEQSLLQSLHRRPTAMTLWLANRIVNARDDNSLQFIDALCAVARRSDIPPDVRGEAEEFCELHTTE